MTMIFFFWCTWYILCHFDVWFEQRLEHYLHFQLLRIRWAKLQRIVLIVLKILFHFKIWSHWTISAQIVAFANSGHQNGELSVWTYQNIRWLWKLIKDKVDKISFKKSTVFEMFKNNAIWSQFSNYL